MNKDILENLNLEIIDFFYNVNDLLLYVAEININHKPDKNDYYKANLLIKFCDVETITIYKTYS